MTNLALSTSVLQTIIQVNGSQSRVVTNLGVIHYVLIKPFPESLTIKCSLVQALVKVNVKCTLVHTLRFCTGRTAHRGSRGIALLFHGHGTRRGWGVSVTPRPLFTLGKDAVPIVQEAGWAPGPVWTGAENLAPTGIRSPDRPARSQSLYRLRYPAYKVSPYGLQYLKTCSSENSYETKPKIQSGLCCWYGVQSFNHQAIFPKVTVKVIFTLEQATKAQRGSRRRALFFL